MKKEYQLQNDLPSIVPFIDSICEQIKDCFDQDELSLYSVGLYEVIMNAIEHGNLRILYHQKKEWLTNGLYEQNLSRLLASPLAKNTSVYVTISVDSDSVITEVRDEGDGFDVKNQVDTQRKDGATRENGRGIMLIESHFDSVKYNEKGNEVTLLKNKQHNLVAK